MCYRSLCVDKCFASAFYCFTFWVSVVVVFGNNVTECEFINTKFSPMVVIIVPVVCSSSTATWILKYEHAWYISEFLQDEISQKMPVKIHTKIVTVRQKHRSIREKQGIFVKLRMKFHAVKTVIYWLLFWHFSYLVVGEVVSSNQQ